MVYSIYSLVCFPYMCAKACFRDLLRSLCLQDLGLGWKKELTVANVWLKLIHRRPHGRTLIKFTLSILRQGGCQVSLGPDPKSTQLHYLQQQLGLSIPHQLTSTPSPPRNSHERAVSPPGLWHRWASTWSIPTKILVSIEFNLRNSCLPSKCSIRLEILINKELQD